MKGKKRLIALLLSFLMVLSQMSVATFALDTVADENSEQTVEEQAVEETQPEAELKVAAAETEPAAEETAAAETATESESAQPAAAEPAKAEPAKAEEKKAEAREEAFDQSQTVDGVTVNVSAAKGVFPAGSKLNVSKVAVPGAVDTSDAEAAYAFDISILANGKKIQPDGKATVSFTTEEVADYDTAVYHMHDGVQEMSVSESGETASVKTDGFSVYVITFTDAISNGSSATGSVVVIADDYETTLYKMLQSTSPRVLPTNDKGQAKKVASAEVTAGADVIEVTKNESNNTVSTVKVKALKEGTATLKVEMSGYSSTSPSDDYTHTFAITVTEKYKVTFDLDGGELDGKEEIAPQYVELNNGHAVDPGVPTKVGWCSFKGWYEEGAEDPFNFSEAVKNDVNLTARYDNHNWAFDHKTTDCVVYKCSACESTLEASIAFDDEDGIVHYDGNAHGATLTVKLNDEVIGTDSNLPDSSILPMFSYYWKNTTNRIMYARVNEAGHMKDPTGDKPVDVNNYAVVTKIRVTGCDPVIIRDNLTILQAAPIAAEGLVYKDGNALVTDDGLLPKVTTAVVRYLRPGTEDEYVSKDELLNDGSLSAGTHEIPYNILTSDAGDADVIGEGEVEVDIDKATPKVTAPVAKTLTYNTQAQELAEAGKTTGGTMLYALGTSATTAPTDGWSTSVPKGTNVGSYYVWYKVAGDKNYNDVGPACVTATIAARKFAITYDLNGGALNGQTGTVTMTVEEGTVITLPSPTRDGYTFDYWEGSKYYAGDKYTVTEDHTLKAVWKVADSGKKADSDKKDDSGKKKGVNTGDTNDIADLLALMLVSVGALGALGYRRRKEDQ